jgi:hypothetical protein
LVFSFLISVFSFIISIFSFLISIFIIFPLVFFFSSRLAAAAIPVAALEWGKAERKPLAWCATAAWWLGSGERSHQRPGEDGAGHAAAGAHCFSRAIFVSGSCGVRLRW